MAPVESLTCYTHSYVSNRVCTLEFWKETGLKMALAASQSRIYGLAAISAGILFAAIVLDAYRKRRNKENSRQTNRVSESQKKIIDKTLLPTHLERDLYKERRWQKMMPKLAMKKPLYDNILMKEPNGTVLCSVSMKKANWYIARNLATWENVPDESSVEPASLRLLFAPRGSSSSAAGAALNVNKPKNDETQIHLKQNRCVICGRNDPSAYYMRHSIVPYCLRSLLPAQYKTHLPHDIVVVCAETCHVPAAQRANERVRMLDQELLGTVSPPKKFIVDSDLRRVKTAAKTLLQRRDKLPDERVQELERIMLDYAKKLDDRITWSSTMTDAQLQEISQLNDHALNRDCKTGAQRIMESLLAQPNTDEVLSAFIKDWRLHFVETMTPDYLPHGWSIDSPVKCDDRS
ncbi:hypothetical protein MPSEU_000331800 [Mayamaea pseudoterrestris]|nr:hypothetical protein MPSEU_000331800 [Mayamaea pseudoterrestris]